MDKIETFTEFVLLLKWLLDNFSFSDISIYHSNNGLTITEFIEHVSNENLVIEEDNIKIKHDIVRLNIYDTGWKYSYNDSNRFIIASMKKEGLNIEIAFQK